MEEISPVRLLTSEYLAYLKRRALRRRVWFSVLSRLERNIVELTISCVNRVKSSRLALVIGRIVCRLLKALRSRFLERVETVGYGLADRISGCCWLGAF